MMITSEIVQVINDLEARFPVDQWSIRDIRVWPLYRIGLYFGYVRAHQASPPASGGAGRLAQVLFRAGALASGLLRYGRAELADGARRAAASRPVDALFLSDGISFANIDGAWYEKFCDPLMRRLQERGRSSLLLSLSHNYLTPRSSPSIFLQPRIDWMKIRTRFHRGPAAEHLPGIDDLAEHARQAGIASYLPSLAALRWQALHVRAIADLYRSILRAAGPRIGFVVSYYGTEGMAFNLACREHGIPSVDIQHGVAGELCPPYGRWMRVPAGGYGLLPSLFWCWTDADAEAIDRWSPGGRYGHTAVVGGNPWLQEWLSDDSEMVKRYDHEFSGAYPGSGREDERRLLVTLQTGFSTGEHLGPLLEAMRRAPAGWSWMVRLHPCMQNESGRITALFKDAGIAGVELRHASSLPLFALLRHTDIHITHSSATVVEASSFGVPSVIISTYGTEFFRREIDAGWARPAYTADAVLAAIGELHGAREHLLRTAASGSEDAGTALSGLIDLMDRNTAKG